MAQRNLVRSTQSSKLLTKLVDNPQLPALVPQLKTPTLTRLIKTVGVEDAGPIVAHTTTVQLQRVFDEMLWDSLVPGGSERMSPEAFIQWLEVLNDQGDTFVAERLEALGTQFLVSQLANVIEVQSMHDSFAASDEAAEVFGAYKVLAKFVEEWDVVRTALAALNADFPDFMGTVLANLTSVARLGGIERPSVNAQTDESQDRDKRREADGFLTPQGAREFLNYARTRPLDELSAMNQYDPASRRYLTVQADDDSTAETNAVLDASIDDLARVLAEAQVIPRTMRLENKAARKLPIKELLDRLELSDPGAFADRLAELVLLGNILVAGTTDQGEQFSEVEAANAALSISNMGAAFLVSQRNDDIDAMLSAEPGLTRAFSVGWHILHQIPTRAVRLLVATLREPALRTALAAREWILTEVDVAIADLVNNVDLAQFNDVRDSLSIVSLVIEPDVCERLRILIAEFPRLPLETIPGDKVAVTSRHFDSLEDLREVDAFLADLGGHIKL